MDFGNVSMQLHSLRAQSRWLKSEDAHRLLGAVRTQEETGQLFEACTWDLHSSSYFTPGVYADVLCFEAVLRAKMELAVL